LPRSPEAEHWPSIDILMLTDDGSVFFDLNESESSDNDEGSTGPSLMPPPQENRKRSRHSKSEWDKLTVPYLNHGFGCMERIANTTTRTRAVLTTETHQELSNRERRAFTKREAPRMWQVGDRCEAKFRAQWEGNAVTRWYPGKVDKVTRQGCDVLFDDGDFEEAIPLRYVRTPRGKKVLQTVTNSQTHQQCASQVRTPDSAVDTAHALIIKLKRTGGNWTAQQQPFPGATRLQPTHAHQAQDTDEKQEVASGAAHPLRRRGGLTIESSDDEFSDEEQEPARLRQRMEQQQREAAAMAVEAAKVAEAASVAKAEAALESERERQRIEDEKQRSEEATVAQAAPAAQKVQEAQGHHLGQDEEMLLCDRRTGEMTRVRGETSALTAASIETGAVPSAALEGLLAFSQHSVANGTAALSALMAPPSQCLAAAAPAPWVPLPLPKSCGGVTTAATANGVKQVCAPMSSTRWATPVILA